MILASQSPRRRDILTTCGVRYRVTLPEVDEPAPTGADLRGWVRRWALRKALSVESKALSNLVVAADTIVVYRGRGLGKPKNAGDAVAMLSDLSGRTHHVLTGVAVLAAGPGSRRGRATGAAISHVRFRKLSAAEIKAYVATGEPFDKAGGYAIQGRAGRFVASVKGPIDNVVGLPVRRLAQLTMRALDDSQAR